MRTRHIFADVASSSALTVHIVTLIAFRDQIPSCQPGRVSPTHSQQAVHSRPKALRLATFKGGLVSAQAVAPSIEGTAALHPHHSFTHELTLGRIPCSTGRVVVLGQCRSRTDITLMRKS